MQAVAVAAVALLVACGNDGAEPPPFRGIAYVRYFSAGRSEVRLARIDGTALRPLARGGIVTLLSPDGRWVAFIDNRYDLYVVSASGGAPWRLARSVWPNQWSPDSSFLLAERIEDAPKTALVTVDLDGKVKELRRAYIGRFSLSPDGEHVCFDQLTGQRQDLYVMDVDGRNVRRLTSDGASGWPLWAEHGIAFARLVRTGKLPNNAWGADEIWRINPDGKNARRVARPPARLLGSGITGFAPEAWSADGRRIVASLTNEFGGPPFAVDVATGTVRQIGDYSYHAAVGGLSRDGRYVLVEDRSVELNHWWRVDVVPYAGGRPRLIARFAGGASWNR